MRTLLVASVHKRRNAVVNPELRVSTTFANSDVFVLMVSSLLRTAHASLKRDVKIVRFYLQKYVIFPIRRIFIIEICPGENKSYTTCASMCGSPKCADPYFARTTCPPGCLDGCFCKEGYALEKGDCIPIIECPASESSPTKLASN